MFGLAYIWAESLHDHSMIRSSLLIASFYAALGKRKQTKNILDDVMMLRCLINPNSQLADDNNYDIVKHADGDAPWRLISSTN